MPGGRGGVPRRGQSRGVRTPAAISSPPVLVSSTKSVRRHPAAAERTTVPDGFAQSACCRARYTVALDTPKVRTSSLIDSPPRSDRACRACARSTGAADRCAGRAVERLRAPRRLFRASARARSRPARRRARTASARSGSSSRSPPAAASAAAPPVAVSVSTVRITPDSDRPNRSSATTSAVSPAHVVRQRRQPRPVFLHPRTTGH